MANGALVRVNDAAREHGGSHTNLDTYERIVPEDARQAATVIAAAVWHVANREEMLPRFTKEQMPPLAAQAAR